MKKLLTIVLIAIAAQAYAQGELKNGTIYKEHPYITVVKKIGDLIHKHDTTALFKLYADSVRFFEATAQAPKSYNLAKNRENWKQIYNDWDIISVKQVGYPDGLAYEKEPFTVQSWWNITVVNKKTKKTATFQEVVFNTFNKDGKITGELSYYDPSALIAAMK